MAQQKCNDSKYYTSALRYKYIDVMFTGIRGFKFKNDVLEFTTTRYIQSSKPRIQMTMNMQMTVSWEIKFIIDLG